MGVLQLLAADQSTVLFDFANPTGSGNPSSLVTKLMTGIDLGTVTPSLSLFGYTHGAQLLDRKHEPIEMVVPFSASATTDDNLWSGLGTLARYLETASPGQPVVLAWNELTSVRYIDVIAALNLPQLLRGQGSAGLVASRKASLEPISLRLLRQPWARRAEVTTTARTVPNNPITAGSPGSFVGRIYRDTILGDLPTPGKIKVTMDSGSAVERTLIAHIPLGTRASTVFDDYLSDTAFVNCESTNRGWTVSLTNDTSSTGGDGSASNSTVARVSNTGTTVTDMVRRFRATRTTKLDSLRGVWRPQLRVKLQGSVTWEVELVWAPTSGEGFYREGAVTLDLETLGTPSTFGYTEVDLGHMHLPTDVALGGITVEIWARRISGSGHLDLDLLWFPPDEPQGTAVVPSSSSSQTWLGKTLLTPVSNPAGGTAGTVVSNDLRFNATTNNAGVGLAAGTVLPAGRYVSTFRISNGSVSSVTVATGVRNITSSSYAAGLTTQNISGGATKEFSHVFDANGTSAYQEQVDNPSVIDTIRVKEIRREYVASLTSGESVRTDPGARNAVDRLDASGNVKAYLASEGEVPAMLVPGEELVLVRCDEVALPLHGDLNENVLGRVPTVSITYSPRDLL